MEFETQLELCNEFGELGRVEQFIRSAAQQAGLDERTAYLLCLACDELVTNIITHGYRPDETGLRPILLSCHYAGGVLGLRLIDEGCAFDPLSKASDPELSLSIEERKIGGLGIHFVRTIMDEVHYERTEGRNVLTMCKRI